MLTTYYSIGDYYKKRLGTKTYKIPVTVVDDCPNRRGLNGMETCIFCDEWGSAAYKDNMQKPLHQQIEECREAFTKRYKIDSFLVYFQAYTNSFKGVEKLRKDFDLALSYPFVKGIVIGTRPDCISSSTLKLWKEYSEKTYVSVELGVQSFYEEQVAFLKRGHTAKKSIEAVYKIKEAAPKVDVGLHFIFGIPGETDEQIIESAKIASSLPIDNVKVHNLHVLKNTGLETLYRQGDFEPISLEEFAHKCILFLEHLSPEIPVHRLGALSNRWDELIAPLWNRHKMYTRQFILDRMKERQSYHGKLYVPSTNYAMLNSPGAPDLLKYSSTTL
ncbi:MAG: TIGR01212 family radical SAM protein [Bdellovibrionales bacterium]|nr:TIGR01212 family radical SAM protein [Bdellovibrionales bacterium]